uniref:Uncharacterized protein n=1 Tax=Chromera velia CCMP2878 TaxID=1169474 RepID=A0A0G4I7B0_9ALVE|eukprot:Cvel_11637.t1-p1 / transcript=Cvel_11637.t1 / gene=Cvel_11637 / organism=Chromera_velia_CCMP2878 / gene_product=hypothetical protein / transcript_product=hypothetical protein / location=Cvel_scaffold737:15082-15438(-) / protein_length=119 / sequence_SO=supercontig / SO=protein_coding / is_pseudo=false
MLTPNSSISTLQPDFHSSNFLFRRDSSIYHKDGEEDKGMETRKEGIGRDKIEEIGSGGEERTMQERKRRGEMLSTTRSQQAVGRRLQSIETAADVELLSVTPTEGEGETDGKLNMSKAE